MACWERLDISALVVADDDTSLTIVANILSSWEYKVMSADNRKSAMSKSLENGASLYVLKPVCAGDSKDIWQYATAARNGKLVIENQVRNGEGELPDHHEKMIFLDGNSSASSSSLTSENKGNKNYNKRKSSSEMNKDDQSEGTSRAPQKKPKIVWTTYLHNLFLLAIKHIGLDKAVPKKILEIMNVPDLTRENVASHLQKYRIFLRKVAERGIIQGISDRALRSRFASELPVSVIKDIQTRTEKLSLPVQEYLKGIAPQRGHGSPITQGLLGQQASSSSYLTSQLGREQFLNPLKRGHNGNYNNASNQVRLGQSSFGSRMIGANVNNNIHKNILGSYRNTIYDQGNSSYNSGPVFPAYVGMAHGLLTTSNGLTGGLKHGDPMFQNYGSLGNQNFSCGLENGNMASLSSPNLPLRSACYPSSSISSGIQLNGEPQMAETGVQGGFNSVGITTANPNNNNDSFGLMDGTQNANMNVAPFGNGNSGLVQGCYASSAMDVCADELSAALMTNATAENTSGIQQLPQLLEGPGNAAGNEDQCNASAINEGQTMQLDDDLSKLFLMLDDMQLLNETGENLDANEFVNSDFSSSSHVVQSPKQPQIAADVIVPSTENNIILPNEAPETSNDKSPSLLQRNDGFLDWEPFDRMFEDDVSTASNSITEQDWDLDLIEAMFGPWAN